jgi:hypothetical protein
MSFSLTKQIPVIFMRMGRIAIAAVTLRKLRRFHSSQELLKLLESNKAL